LSISFGSINTGLPKDIVQQIMAAEKVPIQKMEVNRGKIEQKSALLNQLIGLLETARSKVTQNANLRSLTELKTETNDEIVSIVADKNVAKPGSYQLEVVQMARKSSAMSSGFSDPKKTDIGVGYIQYFLPDGSKKELYVDSKSSTLDGIAKLINKNPQTGMRASIVNDGTGSDKPWRLILSLSETGDENRAEFPKMYFVDGEEDLYLEFEREAHDAIVKLDGFQIELKENKATDLIPGVTIDLKKAQPGTEFSIIIKEDTEVVTGKIVDMVEDINNILRFIKEQNTMDANTDTTKTLGGDSTLKSLESRIRAAVFKGVETEDGTKRLSDLGIAFQKDGLLQVDSNRFNAIISDNYKVATNILSGTYNQDGTKSAGFIDNVGEALNTVLRFPDGLLRSRARTLKSSIDQIDRRIEQRQKNLEQKEQGLKDKFARLEGTIARIQGQGAGVSALNAGAIAAAPQLG
jgi:flagellar hook-associated protein 2